jgi:seryl-tRNA synthetase
MHDIRAIRENFEGWKQAMGRRSLSAEQLDQLDLILALDSEARRMQTTRQESEAARNAASKAIGVAKARKDETEAARLMAEVGEHKQIVELISVEEEKVEKSLRGILESLPNVPAPDVPDGADEEANREVRRWDPPSKTPGQQLNQPQDHVALGEALGMMDFEAAARMSGARFVALKGKLARLERALAAFMVDLQTETHGYQEVSPPILVHSGAMKGTGQLPKFATDQFRAVSPIEGVAGLGLPSLTAQTTLDYLRDDPGLALYASATERGERLYQAALGSMFDREMWLIPTAEVSLTNLYREQILAEADLATPIRMTADTPCFRSEAGSAGRDTRGMIRMHQFRKVELVSIAKPEDSDAEHERMTRCAEEVLKRLGLPFRTMLLCTGDMGFSAKKTYDLEVWLPSQGKYREISSCSTCGDFQARRMDARFRRDGQKGTEFVHTLNGSGLAVGRTLVAVMENYQNADGSITVPEALVPYMGGLTTIAR